LEKDPAESSAILKYRDGIDYLVIDTTWTSIYPQGNQWPADFVYGALPGAERGRAAGEEWTAGPGSRG